MSLLGQAIAYAAEMHQHQTRKFTNDPYVLHPIHVSCVLATWGMKSELQIAGVLHDTLEDTHATAETIQLLFGKVIESLVIDVTTPEPNRDENRRVRKCREIGRLHNLGTNSRILKCADIQANLTTFKLAYDANPEWAKQYLHEKIASFFAIKHDLPAQVVDSLSMQIIAIDQDIVEYDKDDVQAMLRESLVFARTETSTETRGA